ncbi:SpaA isopeptide-forming pilin-related protein [Bulleidia sp. HCP3S3_F2]|uniref:SpaA isopeptide-forming pilin-related protein n=1 Tax=unclassified Bulleidia TaxID=2704656 RepID=UPI003F8A3746
MKLLNRMKRSAKKTFTSFLALLTMTSVVSLPSAVTAVHADGGLDVNTAIANYITVSSSGSHYSFNGGNNFDVIMTGSKAQLDQVGLDCTAGAVAIVAHALRDAGADPYAYFDMLNGVLNTVYPPSLRSYFENHGKWSTVANGPVDASALLPGDILIYGTSGNGHMAVYTGGGQMFDFRSNGHGSSGNYRGFANYSEYKTAMASSSGTGRNVLSGVYRANVDKNVSINLTKVSANTSITDGLVNAYSLAGAEYGIYSDAAATNQIGTITTGADGKGSVNVKVGFSTSTLYYKETKAPKGYCLDATVRPFSFSGTSASINVSDMPGNDPLRIVLTKNNEMTNGDNPASLAGAQFTVRYYDVDPSNDYTVDQLNAINATRTWVIETKETTTSSGKTIYRASLDDKHKVDGDDLYKTKSGIPTIPVGVITVEETKAPDVTYTDEDGNEQLVYTLNNKTLNGNTVLGQQNGKVVMKISGDGINFNLQGGNDYTISEIPKKGGFYTSKIDAETGKAEPQGNGSLDGASYEIINDNAYQVGTAQVASAAKGERVWSFTTSNGGVYSSPLDALQVGHYIVRETDPSTGYLVAGTTEREMTVNENRQTFLSGDKTFTEQTIRGGFKFQKNDTDTATYPQGNTNLQATLKLINTSVNQVWVDSNGDGQFSEDEYFANGEAIKLPQSFVTAGTANTNDATFTTTTDGYFETVTNALPFGSYKIVEVTAPTGFAMDGDSVTETTFDVTNDGELVDKRFDIKNDVFTGKFDVQKMLTSSNNGHSTTMKPEANVEFTAFLKATVDEKFGGDYKLAYETVFGQKPNVEGNPTPDDSQTIYDADGNILFTTKEYDVVTTNESGMAYSRDLAYGEYYIFQSSHADGVLDYEGNVSSYDGAIFNVTEENQPTKHFYVANNHQLYILKMNKVSDQTGEKIELNNAVFKIKDSNGNYVKQKIGNKVYDQFSTTTRKMIVDTADGEKVTVDAGTFVTESPSENDAAKAYTALGVEAGTYYITEVKTPAGFTTLKEPIEVVAKESAITEVDQDGTNYVEVEVPETQITGKLVIKKSLEKWEKADKTFVNHDDLSGIGFTLTAKEDIIDPADGSVLVKAGEQAVRLTGDRNNPYEKVNEIFVDAEGNATVTNLPLGKYTLTETTVPDGIVKSGPKDIEFAQEKDNVEKAEYEVTEKINNKVTKVTVKKTDVAGAEIAGAKMSVTDKKTGATVVEWTSEEGKNFNVEGLTIGKIYTLNEDLSPLGYVKASSIDFTVDETGAVTEQTMIDKILTVRKVDMCGSNVEGAQITIYNIDEEGSKIEDSIVDQWTTEKGKHHDANNLEVGKTYVASETVVPAGYAKAPDYKFTVADDKKNQTETIYNKQVTISKVDAGGKEVEGAKLTLTDKETGEIVDQWISTNKPHYPTGIEIGKTYILTEDTAPLGYIKSTQVEFTVTDNGIDQKITMVDEITRVAKTDENGNYVKGATLQAVAEDGTVVDEWVSGSHIVDIAEADATKLEDGETVIYESEDGTVTKIIPVAKVTESDDDDAKVVNGSTDADKEKACEVKTDEDNGNTDQDSSDSEKKEYTYTAQITKTDGTISYYDVDLNGEETTHRVSNLNGSSSYTIREVKTVDGYYYFENITTDTTEDGKNQSVTAIDNSINYQIAKVDDNGDYVQGVTLKLTDITDAENPVEVELPNNGITTNEPFKLDKKLIAEHTYELVESEYVAGVYKATNITFTVPKYGTSEVTTITMMDETTNITVKKVDNYGKPVAGALMQILVPKTEEVVYEFTSTDDEHGSDISKYVKGGERYILRESEAPFGFNTFENIEFTVSGKKNEAQVLIATDVRKTYYVSAKKVDAQNTSKTLKGAEITLFNADNTVAKDVNGKECVGTTDENGVITWNVEFNGDNGGYYVKETGAPAGYRINNNKYAVELSEDYDFAQNNPVIIVVNDEALPAVKTGVGAPFIAGGIFVFAIGLLFILNRKKKKSVAE